MLFSELKVPVRSLIYFELYCLNRNWRPSRCMLICGDFTYSCMPGKFLICYCMPAAETKTNAQQFNFECKIGRHSRSQLRPDCLQETATAPALSRFIILLIRPCPLPLAVTVSKLDSQNHLKRNISSKVLVILLCDSSNSVRKESGVLYMSLENK